MSDRSPGNDQVKAPPAGVERLLRLVLPQGHVSDTILGDLREQFERRAASGRFGARWWYRREGLALAGHTLIQRLRGRPLAGGRWGDRAGNARMSSWMMVRTALRTVRRSPGFAATVAGTLAIGLGGNFAVFEMADRLLLAHPDHVQDSDRVFRMFSVQDEPGATLRPWFSEPDIRALEQVPLFESVAAYSGGGSGRMGLGRDAQQIRLKSVSAELLPLLGVDAVRGRRFDEADDQVDAERTLMLTWDFWRSSYGSDPDIIGQLITLNQNSYRVIGITPAGFTGVDLTPVDLFVALNPHQFAAFGSDNWVGNRRWQTLFGVARLRTDADVDAAAQAATAVWAAPRVENDDPGGTVSMVGLRVVDSPNAPPEVAIAGWLLGVSILLMIIACANVTNLMLMRGVKRRRLMAVHRSLGMSGFGVAGTMLIEALILALIGATGAMAAAHLAGSVLQPLMYPGVHFPTGLPGARLFLYAGLATATAALVAGFVPTVQALRTDPVTWLRDGSGGSSGRRRFSLLAVAVQAGLSVVLVVGAGLFVRSLHNATSIDMGFDPSRVVAATLLSEDDPGSDIMDRAAARLRGLPGVQAASSGGIAPFRGGLTVPLRTATDSVEVTRSGPWAYPVDAGFIQTLDLPLFQGRYFTEDEDRAGAPPTVIVNDVMAQRLWPGGDAIGQCLIVGSVERCSTVVGVVADHSQRSLIEEPSMKFYVPFGQGQVNTLRTTLVIRTEGPATRLLDDIRAALWEVDPAVTSVGLTPYTLILSSETRSWRLGATVFTAFGALALLVAGIGLYSVLGSRVAEQQRELGIRMALGASATRLLNGVLTEAIGVTVVGVVGGLALAVALAGRLQDLLFAVQPHDAAVFILSGLGLIVVAILSALLPALRATQADPVEALRSD